MGMVTGPKVLYEFGPFRVDPDKQVLLRDNQPVSITPKTLETLLILVRHSREVVSKDDLMNELWPDAFVEEANLSQNIFMLRKALGDTPDERRYIVTLPGKGYRFVAEVRTVAQDGEDVIIASRTRSQVVLEQSDSAPAESLPALPAGVDRKLRWAGLVAIAAIAGLLAIVAAFFIHRRQPATVGERNSVVIADFTNTTGDAVFDETLRQGLAVQLEQSPFLSLVSEDRIQQTLSLMGQPPDARLAPDIARQVCERTGSVAVLEGSIASLGSLYVLGLRAKDCRTGDVLGEEQAQAATKEDVLNALTQIATKFRTRLGESLTTVEKHNVPLEMATTSSLEALKAFSTGMRLDMFAGSAEALPLLERAVELDPQFAMAYAMMGLMYSSIGESVRAVENTSKAYQLRDHTSDRERFFITTLYDRDVTGNLEKELQTLQSWAQMYPLDRDAHGLQSGYALQGSGQYEKSIEEANIGLGIDPDFGPGYVDIAFSNLYLGRLAEVEEALQRASEHKREWPELSLLRYYLAFLKSDTAAMERTAAFATGNPAVEDRMLNAESLVEAYHGRLQSARGKSHSAVEMAQRAGQKEAAATYQAGQAVWEALFGNTVEARRSASSALRLSNGRDVEYPAAFAFALTGDLPRAELLIGDLEKRFPEDTTVQFNYLPALRALLALQQHDPRKAIEVLQVAVPNEQAISAVAFNFFFGAMYPAYVRGQAYLGMGQATEAATEFQKILTNCGLVLSDPIGAMARLQLGRAYALQGDTAKARAAYQDFLTLWKDADPDILILKQAEAEYAKLR
jgi:eukaryotic-like serine/threonine-protein kinase